MKERGIALVENGKVVPNPHLRLIQKLGQLTKEEGIDFILAVGGGSVIDTAKAVALAGLYEGDVWDFFTGKASVKEALPIGVLSTVASSGSETSNATIVSKDEYKRGVEDEAIIPKFAIMNPSYTLNVPAFQTAAGIADMFSHLLERYFSKVPHTDLTDALIEGAARTLMANAKRLMKDLTNYDLRAEIALTSIVAHNNSLEMGREPDWGSHRIEHELSGQYNIVHGEGMAIVLLAWMRYMKTFYPDLLVKYGVRLFDIDPILYTKEEVIDLAIAETEDFFKAIGLRTRLRDMGIDGRDFEVMAKRATANDQQTVGHLKALTSSDIVAILNLAL